MSLQNTAGVSKTDTPVTPRRPLQFKLKREIILVLLFKLVLLFSIKAAFFPQRLPADAAAHGMEERILPATKDQLNRPGDINGNETDAKEKQ